MAVNNSDRDCLDQVRFEGLDEGCGYRGGVGLGLVDKHEALLRHPYVTIAHHVAPMSHGGSANNNQLSKTDVSLRQYLAHWWHGRAFQR